MSIRPCLPFPNPILKRVSTPVQSVDDQVRAIWADMVDTMEAMPGLGLAAPQIGYNLRLAVVDCSIERGQAILMANPEILHASAQMRDHEEASPNLPGVGAVIARSRAVMVRYLNGQGLIEERDFVQVWAASVQHQIDHLNGKLYFDHLSPLRRKMLLARAQKLESRA